MEMTQCPHGDDPVRLPPHGDDPAWFWHLVVHLSQCGSHLVSKSACHDHHICLALEGMGRREEEKDIKIKGMGIRYEYGDETWVWGRDMGVGTTWYGDDMVWG